MKQQHIDAIKLLNTYTAGSFDIWRLSGKAKASVRAHIMSVYNGKKTPQSKSGISILRSELWPLSDPDLTECTCQAEREKHFIAWAKHLCNKKQPVDYNHNTYMDTGGIWGN